MKWIAFLVAYVSIGSATWISLVAAQSGYLQFVEMSKMFQVPPPTIVWPSQLGSSETRVVVKKHRKGVARKNESIE